MIFSMVSCDEAKDLFQVSSNIPMPLSTGSCADAKYLKEARAWDVTPSYGTIFENVGRIELTASGNYMFLPDMSSLVFDDMEDEMFAAPRLEANGSASNVRSDVRSDKGLSSPFKKGENESTRASESYPAGTFTKISDNEYELSNLGRLIVNNDGTLTLNDGAGNNYVFNVTAVSSYELDELTRRLSRTWELVQVERAYYDSDGKLTSKRYLSQKEIEDDYVRAVVMTQYGAFVRYNWDGTLDDEHGLWRWEIPEKQIFQFVFTNNGYYGYANSGLQQVYFYDDFVMFLGEGDEDESESDEYYEIVDVLKAKSVNGLDL